MPELGTRSDFSWQQALAWRMERHHLVERAAPSDLVRMVREICGLHAQLMSSAELSMWARIDGLERDAVQEALWRHRALGVWLSALGTQTKNHGLGGGRRVGPLQLGVVPEGGLLPRIDLLRAGRRPQHSWSHDTRRASTARRAGSLR
jgi:hypothetical protein